MYRLTLIVIILLLFIKVKTLKCYRCSSMYEEECEYNPIQEQICTNVSRKACLKLIIKSSLLSYTY